MRTEKQIREQMDFLEKKREVHGYHCCKPLCEMNQRTATELQVLQWVLEND